MLISHFQFHSVGLHSPVIVSSFVFNICFCPLSFISRSKSSLWTPNYQAYQYFVNFEGKGNRSARRKPPYDSKIFVVTFKQNKPFFYFALSQRGNEGRNMVDLPSEKEKKLFGLSLTMVKLLGYTLCFLTFLIKKPDHLFCGFRSLIYLLLFFACTLCFLTFPIKKAENLFSWF
jgi:hypothetical protein